MHFPPADALSLQIDHFEDTVHEFLSELVARFGPTEIKCNHHILSHLAANIRLHGPPVETTMFAAERMYGEVARATSSNRSSESFIDKL